MFYMGEVFREVRQGRKISLKEATGGEFSYSMLSRFENGESDISATKLFRALDNIHMELSEFSYLLRGYQPTTLTLLNQKIWEAMEKSDLVALQALYEQEKGLAISRGDHHFLQALIVKGHMVILDETIQASQEEKAFIADYLFLRDIWGEYELTFFSDIAPLLDLELYFRYTRELLQKADYFSGLTRQRNLIHTILLNGLFKAISDKAMTKFAYFDKQLRNIFFEENETYLRLIYRFVKGQELCFKGQIQSGIQQMEEVVAILRLLDCQSSADYYQKGLDEWRQQFE